MPRTISVLVLACAVPALASAQSLADVARAEAARRKAVDGPVKVYTNESLKPDFTKPAPPAPVADETTLVPTPVPPVGDAPTPGAPLPAAAPPDETRDQAYWSARITAARAALARSQTLAAALQSRINALATDFVNRDDPAQRSAIADDRLTALAELERLQREIEDQQQAIADIQEEARRAGVPPGWLRP
ncbi:MAG: hypothetical protein AB7O67_00345 [Vicinamibacterales bacterium]